MQQCSRFGWSGAAASSLPIDLHEPGIVYIHTDWACWDIESETILASSSSVNTYDCGCYTVDSLSAPRADSHEPTRALIELLKDQCTAVLCDGICIGEPSDTLSLRV